ncbi:NOP5/NOP56 family protein [Methanosphaera cuniculi]|uniref:NOP5/NOP56 family protein n=1 Tax=Methanosphaera cuniculi TaxID=1077256 RepID=UPI0026DD89D5|nr:ATP-binding protein [Methanosphaera cuniculi]
MKCYITTTSFGFIATNHENNIIDYTLFEDQVESIEQISQNKLLPVELIQKLEKQYDTIIIETNKPQQYTQYKTVTCETTTKQGQYIRKHLDEIISEITTLNDTKQITENLNTTFNQVTQDKIRSSIEFNDVMIVETINSLDEIDETIGKLIERLHEWCMPYLPELEKLHNHKLYAKLVANETTRENIKQSSLLDNTNIELYNYNDITVKQSDLIIIKSFAKSICSLYDTKETLEEYIKEKMIEVAPNLYSVAGANLGAKLIAHINGLENLAKLPSSTVQIMGAEKATFRHLKTGENPPKHGLIYQHPNLRGSNWWVRGKIARTIASKISIAARKDAFGDKILDPTLKEDMETRIEQIRKDHPFPERKNKKSKDKKNKKNKKEKKQRKQKGKKRKRNKKKLRKEDYNY